MEESIPVKQIVLPLKAVCILGRRLSQIWTCPKKVPSNHLAVLVICEEVTNGPRSLGADAVDGLQLIIRLHEGYHPRPNAPDQDPSATTPHMGDAQARR